MKSDIGPFSVAFVFAAGATVATLMLAPPLAPLPKYAADAAKAVGLAPATGCLRWGASMVGLMWASICLDPARVAIVLMTAVLAGALSAAFLANEQLRNSKMLGGALVLCAGVRESNPAGHFDLGTLTRA